MRDPGNPIEALVDSIIASGLLSIEENVRWVFRDGTLKARLEVKHPEYMSFRLDITKNPHISRCSIQLVFDGRPVRRFCQKQKHENPADCTENPSQKFIGHHKHKWSDLTGDECIYIPDDISLASVEQMFYDFCTECGIVLDGRWIEPPEVQLGFGLLP
jgi:hypothetical protein